MIFSSEAPLLNPGNQSEKRTVILDKILHYNLEKDLGEGRYGERYMAWDEGLDRIVLVEFVCASLALDEDFRRRFRVDMDKLGKIEHENIAAFYALEETGGKFFIIREYIEGRTLKEILAEEALSYTLFLSYALQLVKALGEAEEQMVVHRSVASQNIVIGGDKKLRLVNFGLAGGCDTGGHRETISPYEFYLAPEQTENQPEDTYSDMFSLGVVFYEMLTRRLPFRAGDREGLFRAIREETPDFDNEAAREMPPDGRLLIEKLMSKNPAERFRDFQELRATLETMQAYHFQRVDSPDYMAKHKNPRTYLMISILVALIIIFWMVISTVYK